MMPADYEHDASRTHKHLILFVLCGVVGALALRGGIDAESGEIQSWFAAIQGLILFATMFVS